MWYRYFIVICFFFSAVVKGQSSVRFDSIADKELPSTVDQLDHFFELKRNLDSFVGHGVDEIDLQIFDLSNGALLGSIMIELSSNKKGPITYRAILAYLIEIKKEPEYRKAHEYVVTLNQLEEIPANYKNWKAAKSLLQKLKLTENEINDFKKYVKVKQYKYDNYVSLYKAFKTSTVSKEVSNVIDENVFEALFESDGLVDFNALLEKSRQLKKPLLLDFTGYACINCKKMEANFFHKPVLFNIIKEDYILVNIIC